MPVRMLLGFASFYRTSHDPMFLSVLVVVGIGVVLTDVSLLRERAGK